MSRCRKQDFETGSEPKEQRLRRRLVLALSCALAAALLCSGVHAGTLGDIALDELPSRATLVVRFDVAPSELSAALAEVLPAVFSHALAHERVPGLVFTRTLLVSADRLFVEAGLELDGPVEKGGESTRGAIEPSELPAQRSAAVDFYGPYQQLFEAHEQLTNWSSERGLAAVGPPVEYYLTDPTTEPDTSKWLTRVHHPVMARDEVTPALAFVVGRWASRGGDPFYEETWTPFVDGESLGTFRMRRAGTPMFYEFQTIEVPGSASAEQAVSEDSVDQRPTLRIKHFDPGLVGWEEKDEAKVFHLSTLFEGRAVWISREGPGLAELIYERNEEALSVVLRKWGGGAEPSVSTFSFFRATP